MERWQGKVVIVTGASSGIGEATAELLVEHGMNVVSIARRLDRLEELKNRVKGKKGKLFPVKADLTKEEDILSAFQWVEKNLGGVHVLINNAGTCLNISPVEKTETHSWRTVYDTNIIAVQICSREAIKSMRAHNIDDGYIINISSVAAHISSPIPGFVSYCASKKALATISEGLRVELGLSKSKIRVSDISPGFVKTELVDISGMKVPDTATGLASKDIAHAVKVLLELPPNVLVMDMPIRDVGENLKEILNN